MKRNLILGAAAAAGLLVSVTATASPKAKVKKTVVKTAVMAQPGFSEAWVEDETKFEDRKLPARATFIPYSSSKLMMKDETFFQDYTETCRLHVAKR